MKYDVVMGTRTLMTLAEFEQLPDDDNQHELDEGELIVTPPPMPGHGRAQAAIAAALKSAAREAAAGIVVTECGFRLAPAVVRAPDVAFIGENRGAEITWDRYCEFGPDLVVEILSPEDNAARVQKKIRQYFAAGTSIVWVLDSDSVTITAYEKQGVFRTYGPEDRIDAPELLPGFSVQVKTLFE